MKKSFLLIAAMSALLLGACTGKSSQGADNVSDIDMADAAIADTLLNTDEMLVTTGYVTDQTDTNTYTVVVTTNKVTEKTDSTLIDGLFSSVSATGGQLRIVNGVDTAKYDLSSMPAVIKPIADMTIDDVVLVQTEKTFDSNSFRSEIYVRKHPKMDVTEYLNRSLYSSVVQMFDTVAFDAPTPEMNIKQAAEFVADGFEKSYNAEYGEKNVDHRPTYFFDAVYYPDWQSADGNLVTFMLYCDSYYGGAHGDVNALYVTFDKKNNKALGIDDIFTPAGFDKAVELLGKQISAYTNGNITDAAMEISEYKTYYIKHNGKYYPRPALTKYGVAFAYQPYDIASFSEGIRYFLIPYSELQGALKPGLK